MPATPARSTFVQQQFRSLVWKSDRVLAQYGKVARDTAESPIDTFFDDMSAVQIMLDERAAILGRHARAFRVQLGTLIDLSGDYALNQALPGVHIKADELVADVDCAVVAIENYDAGSGKTTIAAWGAVGAFESYLVTDDGFAIVTDDGQRISVEQ